MNNKNYLSKYVIYHNTDYVTNRQPITINFLIIVYSLFSLVEE